MSRRHHHHNLQPYDFERFNEHPRDRDQARGIEYQDDSLSSINSDEESYLHHHPRASKEKKTNFFSAKTEPASKPPKPEKSAEKETYRASDAKSQTNNSDSASTTERLGRLESMLEELIKRNNPAPQPPQSSPEKAKPKKAEGKFSLEPRRHDFTTSMWVNKIQEVSVQNNWSEKSTIQYMGTQMSGIVKAWYNSLPNYDYTWPEWKILITKIFPDNTDFITTLKRLVTRLKQADETISTYYFSKMYLIEACKITGEDAVSCLIDGLNNLVIQEQAKAHRFLTPETLYSQFLMSLPDYTVDYLPTAPPSADSVINNWYYEQEPVEEDAEIAVAQEELIEYERDDREGFSYHSQQGNSGFIRNEDVASQPKRTGTVHSRLGLDKRFIRTNHFRHHNKIPMAARVCTICDKRGHLARNCRKAEQINVCTLLKNPPKNIFYKKCTINDHSLTALIDTGCTTVAIRRCEATDVLDLHLTPSSSQIHSYGGGSVEILGESEVDVEVDRVRVRARAVVVPDHAQDVPVIIGQDFLTQKDVSMFLNNEILKIFRASPYL